MMREELEELITYEGYDPREHTTMELETMYNKYEFKDYQEIKEVTKNGCFKY
jgi:hypothetical protein